MRNTHIHQRTWQARLVALALFTAAVGVRADGDDPVIASYRTRQEDLVQASNVILARADQEGRELTTEERNSIRDNTAEVGRLEGEVTLRAQVAAQDDRLRQPQARRTPANTAEPLDDDPPAAANRAQARAEPHIQTTHISTASTRAAARGNGGFHTVGHWAIAARQAALNPGAMDGRIRAALSTYSNESTGADGGFAVPPDFRTDIVNPAMFSEESLFSRCDSTPTSGNSVTELVDETTPWGTSGIRVYTRAEAQTMQQTKINIKDITVKLHETTALLPVTDELLEDAPRLTSHISNKVGQAFQYKLNDYIINGSGAGMMLGILKAACLVSVAKENAQVAATVHADNIVKMWSRMPAGVRGQAVWLINQDVEPQLLQLGSVVKTASGTAVGGIPAYLPPGGLSNAPYGNLMGRPVIPTEACQALGSPGDIILAWLGGFFAPYKAGGIKHDVSIHLYFDQGVTTFRWVLRVGGQPLLSKPIDRRAGSNTLSHFVTIAERS